MFTILVIFFVPLFLQKVSEAAHNMLLLEEANLANEPCQKPASSEK